MVKAYHSSRAIRAAAIGAVILAVAAVACVIALYATGAADSSVLKSDSGDANWVQPVAQAVVDDEEQAQAESAAAEAHDGSVVEDADGAQCLSGQALVEIDGSLDEEALLSRLDEAGLPASSVELVSSALDGENVLVLVSFSEDLDPSAACEALCALDFVESAEPNYVYQLAENEEATAAEGAVGSAAEVEAEGSSDDAATSDAVSAADAQLASLTNDTSEGNQWEHSSIGLSGAWDLAKCNGEVTVAVIDSGVDYNHEDLADNLLLDYAKNIYSNTTGEAAVDDTNSHGSHVAGIIAAVADNSTGIAGSSYNANILPLKVTYLSDKNGNVDSSGSDYGYMSSSAIIEAIDYAVELKTSDSSSDALKALSVINMSLGGSGTGAYFQTAIDNAYEAGIVVVAAAGNLGGTYSSAFTCYPAACDNVVAVSNLTQSSSDTSGVTLSSSSNTGSFVDIAAPGSSIYSTIPGGSYGYKTGTSMASPVVAAVAALAFAADSSATPDEVVAALTDTALDLGDEGQDSSYGAGEVQADAAVQAIVDGGDSGSGDSGDGDGSDGDGDGNDNGSSDGDGDGDDNGGSDGDMTGTWSDVANVDGSLPFTGSNVQDVQLEEADGVLYALVTTASSNHTVWSYEDGTWTSLGTVGSGLQRGVLAYHDGALYFAGADYSTSVASSDAEETVTEETAAEATEQSLTAEEEEVPASTALAGTTSLWKLSNGSWEQAASLSTAANTLALASIDDALYLLADTQLYQLSGSELAEAGSALDVGYMTAPVLFDLDGEVGLACSDFNANTTGVYCFTDGTWKKTASLGSSYSNIIDVTLGPDGTPYVFCTAYKTTPVFAQLNSSGAVGQTFSASSSLTSLLDASLSADSENVYLSYIDSSDSDYPVKTLAVDLATGTASQLGGTVLSPGNSVDSVVLGDTVYCGMADLTAQKAYVRSHDLAGDDSSDGDDNGGGSGDDGDDNGDGDGSDEDGAGDTARQGHWVCTASYGQGLQRYWIWSDGTMAKDELITPENGAGYYAYATKYGYVVRGTYDNGAGRVYLADNDGKLEEGSGWLVTGKYTGGELQRYYIEDHAARTSYFTVDGAAYFGRGGVGYVLRGAGSGYNSESKASSLYADNDGKLATSKWVCTSVFGQGFQRYWFDSTSAMAKSRLVNPTTDLDAGSYWAYATASGYVLRGTWDNGAGRVYLADGDGLLAEGKTGWLVTGAYTGGELQRYYIDEDDHAARTSYFTVDGKRYFGQGGVGYVLRGYGYDPYGKLIYADNDGVLR